MLQSRDNNHQAGDAATKDGRQVRDAFCVENEATAPAPLVNPSQNSSGDNLTATNPRRESIGAQGSTIADIKDGEQVRDASRVQNEVPAPLGDFSQSSSGDNSTTANRGLGYVAKQDSTKNWSRSDTHSGTQPVTEGNTTGCGAGTNSSLDSIAESARSESDTTTWNQTDSDTTKDTGLAENTNSRPLSSFQSQSPSGHPGDDCSTSRDHQGEEDEAQSRSGKSAGSQELCENAISGSQTESYKTIYNHAHSEHLSPTHAHNERGESPTEFIDVCGLDSEEEEESEFQKVVPDVVKPEGEESASTSAKIVPEVADEREAEAATNDVEVNGLNADWWNRSSTDTNEGDDHNNSDGDTTAATAATAATENRAKHQLDVESRNLSNEAGAGQSAFTANGTRPSLGTSSDNGNRLSPIDFGGVMHPGYSARWQHLLSPDSSSRDLNHVTASGYHQQLYLNSSLAYPWTTGYGTGTPAYSNEANHHDSRYPVVMDTLGHRNGIGTDSGLSAGILSGNTSYDNNGHSSSWTGGTDSSKDGGTSSAHAQPDVTRPKSREQKARESEYVSMTVSSVPPDHPFCRALEERRGKNRGPGTGSGKRKRRHSRDPKEAESPGTVKVKTSMVDLTPPAKASETETSGQQEPSQFCETKSTDE